MDLKEYLITQVFRIVAVQVYPTTGTLYKRNTDNKLELKDKINVLGIKQKTIANIPLEECSARQVFETFISVYMRAEEDLKNNRHFEYWKPKTKSLREIAAEIEDLNNCPSRKAIKLGQKLAEKIEKLFSSGKIQTELVEKGEKLKQKEFDF